MEQTLSGFGVTRFTSASVSACIVLLRISAQKLVLISYRVRVRLVSSRYLCVLGVRRRLRVWLRRARGLMGRDKRKIATLFFLRLFQEGLNGVNR